MGCAGGCTSAAVEPRCGSGIQRGSVALHSDPIRKGEYGLEAPQEARAVEGVGRLRGDYAETAKEIEGKVAAYCGGWPGGPDVTDAHAGERGGKRIRTSA